MESIAILTNYYPPEKGAAANRIEQLAKQLHKKNYQVSIICPLGNYPFGELFPEYKGRFFVKENREGIQVNRLWIVPSNSKNIFLRILSVLSFSLSLIFYLLFKKTPKKIVVQSPPLLFSFLAVFFLRLKRKKIILNVSDLWPLAGAELSLIKKDSISWKIARKMEQYVYKNATIIIGQSQEILTHVKNNHPQAETYLYRNYPELSVDLEKEDRTEEQPIKIFYAGLLGVAQGILELCQKIELQHPKVELHIFGDGAEREQLERFISSNENKGIFFHGMVNRQELHEAIKDFDIALVPLKARIYGSVPSKIFEYACLGFPILYFGGGEGELIIEENNLGWIAPVGDFNALNDVIATLTKLPAQSLYQKKLQVLTTARENFKINLQVEELIAKGVF